MENAELVHKCVRTKLSQSSLNEPILNDSSQIPLIYKQIFDSKHLYSDLLFKKLFCQKKYWHFLGLSSNR